MRDALKDPVVLALSLSQFVISAGLYYLFPALVLFWQDEFGWTLLQVMGAFSTALIMQGLTAKSIGRLLDRGLGPWLMAGGGGLAAICLLALTAAETLVGFYVIWGVLGLTMGLTLYDAVFALIIRARGSRAAGAIALVTLIAGFASSFAFVLAGVLGDVFGWRTVIGVMAVAIVVVHVPMVLAAALRLAKDEADEESSPDIEAPPRSLPGFWPLTVAIASSALGLGMVISHVMPLLSWTGVDPGLALSAAATIGVAQVAGRLIVALIGSDWQRPMLVALCLLGLAVGLTALLLAPWWSALVLVFAVLQGACYGISSALRPLLIRDVLGQSGFGAGQGAVLAPAFVAFGLAPVIAAMVVAMAGYVTLIIVCICTQLISSTVLFGGMTRREDLAPS